MRANGCTRAAATLIEEHAELVRRIAYALQRRLPGHVDVDDLIQVGLIALLEASERHEPERGASFTTYAALRIRGAMVDELRRLDFAPRSLRPWVRERDRVAHRLEHSRGRPVRSEDIAAALGMRVDAYHRALRDVAASHFLSLEEVAAARGASAISEVARASAPGEDQAEEALATALTGALSHLSDREQLVIALHYRQDMRLRDIGAALNVSESRACQLHRRALTRIGAWMRSYLDLPGAASAAETQSPLGAR